MKNLKNIIIGVVLLVSISSCDNADEFRDSIFMTGTEATSLRRMTIDGPAEMGISATITSVVQEDVVVSFSIDTDLVKQYNAEKGSNYAILPSDSYRLSETESVIVAKSNVSKPISFEIVSMDDMQEGITYMVPISLKSAGGKNILKSGRTLYLIINQTIITPAASLASSVSFMVPKFAQDASLKSLGKLSMECRIFVNSFQSKDPFISSIMGIENSENFLLRFGDVTIKPSQLQLTAKDQVTAPMEFNIGKWYHVAAVYDGSAISLYVDGVLQVRKTADKRDAVNLYDGGDFNIGYSYNGRYLNGAISEARVWTKALTQAEVEGNLCYVSPTTEGLLAYWRFNEGTGDMSTDVTGNGYDAQRKTGTPRWIEGVRCPE